MRALDTSVLARLFVDDEDDAEAVQQRPAAVAALSERAFVPVTVLLEFEWVLRSFYDFAWPQIVAVLRALAGIEPVTLEDRDTVLAAMDACEAGMDFAGAPHLSSSSRASAFATFDRALVRRARRLAPGVTVELIG